MFKKPNSKYIVIGIAGVVLIALCISMILITVNRKAVKKGTNSVAEETVPVTQKETQVNKSTEETKTESDTEVTTEETTVEETTEESTAEEVVALGNEEVNNGDSNNYDNSSNNNEEQGNNNSGDSNNSGSYEPVDTPPVIQPETEAPQAHIAYKADGTWDLQKTYFDNVKAQIGAGISAGVMGTSEYAEFEKNNNLDVYKMQSSLMGGGKNDPVYISDYLFLITNRDGSEVECKYDRTSNSFYIVK